MIFRDVSRIITYFKGRYKGLNFTHTRAYVTLSLLITKVMNRKNQVKYEWLETKEQNPIYLISLRGTDSTGHFKILIEQLIMENQIIKQYGYYIYYF